MTNTNDFLPNGYETPQGSANYMKLEKGENKFRILSRPIVGWEDWENKKPLRFRMDAKPAQPIDPTKSIKHFWAFVVWSYKSNSIQILEITQASIQQAITSLSKDADWGNPFTYDIKIVRTGDGMETTYQVNPVPHKSVAKEIQLALEAKTINLEALYSGGDPFAPVVKKPETDNTPF